jgi:hypothetical protein
VTTPKPQPLTYDLIDLEAARLSGASDYHHGFPIEANIYAVSLLYDHETKLKQWAWDLGWREAQHLVGRRKARGAA